MKKVRKMCVSIMLTSVLALSALWLSSCSHDEFPVDKPVVPGTKGTLSFVLPLGSNRGVTYAAGDAITGSDAEYAIENLHIYWFTKTGSGGETSDNYTLFGTFTYIKGSSSNDIILTEESLAATPGNTTVATIEVGDEHTSSRFYVLANVSDGNVALNSLGNGDPASMFESITAKELADSIDAYGNTVLKPIATPLLMSVRSFTTDGSGTSTDSPETPGGFVKVDDPASQGSVSGVHLKRRVARFDIVNTKEYTNFEVTRVFVSNAQKTGFLHDLPFDAATLTKTGNMIIDASQANGPGLTLEGKDEIGKTDNNGDDISDGIDDSFNGSGANVGKEEILNESIFYLYPTELSKNTDASGFDIPVVSGSTEIMIEGKFYGGITRLYKLTLRDDLKIEANKVYRIKIKQEFQTNLRFDVLTVDDWEEADEIGTLNQGKEVDWTNATFSTSDGQTIALKSVSSSSEYVYSSDQPITLTIETSGTNLSAGSSGNVTGISFVRRGVSGVDYLESDFQATEADTNIVSTTTLSYGAYYTTKHVIKLPPTDAPLEVILQIKNPAKKDDCKQITLKSDNVDKSGTPLMKVGDILDASTPLLGQGRWQNAVVTEIASPTATMPTKYDNTWGTIASLVAILDDTKIPKNALTSILNVANTDANTTLSRIAANSNVSTNLKNMATANAGKAQMPSYQNIWYAKDKLGVSTASISGSNSVDAYVIEKIANTNKFHLYRETTAFEYNLDAQYDGWTMAHVLCQLAY